MAFEWAIARFPLPLKGGEGGSATGALASEGAGGSAASSLPGDGVAGSSRSQESPVLDDPVLVASSSSLGRDGRSCSRGRGDSTGDRSCSISSRLSPPWGRDSREGHRGARPWPLGDRALSRESRSCSTDRSRRSRGRKRSRCDFTMTFCPCAVSSLPVVVFRLLPGSTSALTLLEWPLAVSTIALAINWPSWGLA